uniref:Uncharacterized protein n=1 Tax=Schistocephalus solidus TaxID=70667 RepID=A0A0X3PX64_SCHSO
MWKGFQAAVSETEALFCYNVLLMPYNSYSIKLSYLIANKRLVGRSQWNTNSWSPVNKVRYPTNVNTLRLSLIVILNYRLSCLLYTLVRLLTEAVEKCTCNGYSEPF